MNTKSNIIAATILSAGLVLTGTVLHHAIVKFKAMDRTVCAKGLAEMEVNANKVTWPLVYKEIGNDPTEMYMLLEQKNRIVVDFLKKGGLTDDEISVNPPIVADRQADNYGNDILKYRYKAKSVITVTSTHVEKVRQLMLNQAQLMKQGIALVSNEYGNDNISYEFTGLKDVKPQMVEDATKNARVTAQKFADDSNSKLGGIKSAQQGQFSIEDRDANTPYVKKIRVVTTLEFALE